MMYNLSVRLTLVSRNSEIVINKSVGRPQNRHIVDQWS